MIVLMLLSKKRNVPGSTMAMLPASVFGTFRLAGAVEPAGDAVNA
jgi:hypothetical protein